MDTAQLVIDKIQLVQNLYSAFSAKDFQTILFMLSDDVEWGEPANPHNPSGGTRYGHQGFLDWLQTGKEAEEILMLQPKTFSWQI